jgi:hypothetical protein
MPRRGRRLELAGIEAMIADAEAELAALRLRLVREGRPPGDPSHAFDPVGCQGIWLAALRAARDELLRDDDAPPSGAGRPH